MREGTGPGRQRSLSRTALFAVGVGAMVAGFFLGDGPPPFLVFAAGAIMAAIAVLIPWQFEAEVGSEGVSIDTTDRDREVTTGLATDDDAVLAGEPSAMPANLSVPADEVVPAARLLLADMLIGQMLREHEEGPLAACAFHVFLYDEDRERLLPVFEPPDPDGSDGWEPGKGATGVAWAEARAVVAVGDEAHDGTYGLTEEQQRRYADLTAVVAWPVTDDGGDVIAVLTVSTSDEDAAERLEAGDGHEDVEFHALLVGRILVDLLRWFGRNGRDDGGDDGQDASASRSRSGRSSAAPSLSRALSARSRNLRLTTGQRKAIRSGDAVRSVGSAPKGRRGS